MKQLCLPKSDQLTKTKLTDWQPNKIFVSVDLALRINYMWLKIETMHSVIVELVKLLVQEIWQ